MAKDLVQIKSNVLENINAMKNHAILTQLQAYGDLLSDKFNNSQYNAVLNSMDLIIKECDNLLNQIVFESTGCFIENASVEKAKQMEKMISALASLAA